MEYGRLILMREYLGKKVKVVMDRPMGSKHPTHGFIYPINYGYMPNTVSGDGEEIDAYIIGEFEAIQSYEGYVIAIIHRKNDSEDKLVVCKELNTYSKEQVKALTEFQERFFESEIIMVDNKAKKNNDAINIDFSKLKTEVADLLETKKVMVLATSSNNRVTARSMSCVIIDSKIYFQTDKTFLKCEQMSSNPNVALCFGNIQIEGTAKIKDHPFEEQNRTFIEEFKKAYIGSYNSYSHMENEVVIEVTPKLVTLWKYEEGKPLRDFLNFENENGYRKYYDNSK